MQKNKTQTNKKPQQALYICKNTALTIENLNIRLLLVVFDIFL